MLNYAKKLWEQGRDLFPVEGFHFDRPIVLLQSDDWGRAGLRDEEGLDCLRAVGLNLGKQPYDFYTLETADDVSVLLAMLNRHRDSTGRAPCIGMNFIVANLDLARMKTNEFRRIYLLPLADGFPKGWSRSGLLEAYRLGINSGVFYPALHGLTHFCRDAVEREMSAGRDRASFLRAFWQAGTPYIHWRMPWIGYEYWDPASAPEYLPAPAQQELVGQAVGAFSKLFYKLPGSACAPGYRSNNDTHRAWAQYGIRMAQNGPRTFMPPHIGEDGLLHLYRAVEFEPATDELLSVEDCICRAEGCFEQGIPAIVSVHSINFHSSVGGFRERTLDLLDQFLLGLEARHSDLLYLHDEDVYQLIEKGFYQTSQGTTRVNVTKKSFTRREIARSQKAH